MEDEGTNWEELALQARTMLLNNLVKDLNREGLTSSRRPPRDSAGWGLILEWMNWSPVAHSLEMVGL